MGFEEWEQAAQGQQTRNFFPTPSSFLHVRLSNLPHQLTQVLTGHSWLNAHQHRFNFKNSPFCICSNNPETVQHFLFHCALYDVNRFCFKELCEEKLKCWPPNLNELHKNPQIFIAMIKFIMSTTRLNIPSS